MGERRVITLALLTLSAFALGCGAGAPQQHSAALSSPSAARARSFTLPPPTPAPTPTVCGAGATALSLSAPDGSRLEANSVGSGTTAVVFLHQSGRGGMCGFWSYAQWLVAHQQVLAILVNRCGHGNSRCPSVAHGDPGIVSQTQPAVTWARDHGATRVTLVGASYGGGDALQAGGVIPGIAAVVDLSGAGNDTGANDLADAQRLRVPVLFAVAPDDQYCSLTTMQQLFAATPSHPKQLVVVSNRPGVHGWDLLFDGPAIDPLGTSVAAWVVGR